VLEELEETAKLFVALRQRVTPLTQTQLEQLQAAFGVRW
jgi:hypothetical protein